MFIFEKVNTGHEPDEAHIKALQLSLRRYCLALTQSDWDAEDLAQETWVKAFSYMKTTEPTHPNNNTLANETTEPNPKKDTKSTLHPNPEALLFRIARNTWIDVVRRKTTLARLLELEPFKTEELPEYGLLETEAVFQALQEHMSPLQQAVFLLRDVFGHSGLEAAEILDTTEGAVKAALHRARQALPAIRETFLHADGPSLPQDSSLLITLNQLATAYTKGQIAELIELVLANERQEDVMAVSSYCLGGFQTIQSGGYSSMGWNYNEPGMRMVA